MTDSDKLERGGKDSIDRRGYDNDTEHPSWLLPDSDDYQNDRDLGGGTNTITDEKITQQIYDRLADDEDINATYVNIAVVEGVVSMIGSVFSHAALRRAETLAREVPGVLDVRNGLQVVDLTPGDSHHSPTPGEDDQRATTGD